jgi:hypothetical protein
VRFVVLSSASPAGQGPVLRDSVALSDVDGVAEMGVRSRVVGDSGIVRVSLRDQPEQTLEVRIRGSGASVVSAVLPTTASGGDTLSIRGSGFGGSVAALTVSIGTQSASVLTATDTLLRVAMPACLPNGSATLSVRIGTRQAAGPPITVTTRATVAALAPLQVQVVSDTALARGCLALPSDGGRWLVVPHFASGLDAGPTPVPPAGITAYVLSAQQSVVAIRDMPVPPVRTAPVVDASQPDVPLDIGTGERFHATLRAREREWARLPKSRDAGFMAVTAPPAVGSRRTFQVLRGITSTSEFQSVEARLAWVGTNALVYTDAAPPTGVGFTDADIGAIAPLFDNTLHGLAVDTFGPETDLDRNGRVVVLMTQAVNRLTPSTDCSRFIAGFFFGLDMFLGQTGSNGGEVFYSITPDSAGATGCPRSRTAVRDLVPATFIHEFQHMISFGQKVILRDGEQEDIWLNEGLSHIAEETAGRWFEARFPAPTGRTSSAQLFPDSAQAFSPPQLQNAYRWLRTLRNGSTSPTGYPSGTGTLEERGASWAFLRWLGQQYGEGVYGRLVQTRLGGRLNIQAATGRTMPSLYGDFVAALFADSLPGVARSTMPPRLSFGADRNLRRIFARFNQTTPGSFPSAFPISTDTLRAGASVTGAMLPGGMQFTILETPASGLPVQLRLTPQTGTSFAPGLVPQVTLLRLP